MRCTFSRFSALVDCMEGALARPHHHWMYTNVRDTAVLAAAYGFGLTRNHGYTDGNKRIGFMATAVFLDLNGWTLQAPETEVVTMMLGVASAEVQEVDLARWLRLHLYAK
ncbi:type II toxin-antitoxin system death-on-curing family toxin [Thiobaca trueperi]